MLPPVPAGDLVKVKMTLREMVVEVAPGVKYNTWAFDGHGARARSSTSAKARQSR